MNIRAAGALYDMAALQSAERSRFGYKRAAKAVAGLPALVSDLVESGTLKEIPYVGPSSIRIITEVVRDGRSATVESAIERAGNPSRLVAGRRLRGNFLSHFAMQRALAMNLPPHIVDKAAFRGDFQMHSQWSDGGESIATMAGACQSLGHTCMGVTDHSYGLPIARGISMAAAARQHTEIDKLNARLEGTFRVFKGIEANILADGNLDLQAEERAAFEFVVASPHSLLRRPERQTERMVAAVRAPSVAILGHPRGRMFNSRAGVIADWPRVFEAAADRKVAVELDGNWHRQDLDFELARLALDAGCLFALDSDAHSIGELRFTDYAIAHARIAGIPADRVINCWSNEALDAWMEERRG
ncbi:MAG: PHP domain-containing protein [Acidobacteria bacterium]|nr:PHP domain-containing protein [Acidobacteriota bacterium]